MSDRIEKSIELKAPVARVWRALTDYREFGEWFRVKLNGPFVPGQISRGQITWPGYEHAPWKCHPEDRARTTLLLHLAIPTVSIRAKTRFSGDAHPRRVHAGEDRHRHPAAGRLSPASTRFPPTAGPKPSEETTTDGPSRWRTSQSMSPRRPSRVAARQRLRAAAPVFAALGDKTRLSLVARLSGGQPRSISELTHGTRLTRQAITKHLRVLEQAGLVRSSQAGRENRFQLDPAPIESMKEYLNSVSKQWDHALARLKAFVEE